MVLNIETMGTEWDGPNSVLWTETQTKGPDGTWTGHAYGISDDTGMIVLTGFETGHGAYEGLVHAWTETVTDGVNGKIYSLVYPGSPPPGYPVTPFALLSASPASQ